jgi:uncharacterized protein YfdQ (DUF2303 family)
MNVSKEMARLFMNQCVGEHSGHMSMIANNPTLRAMVMCHIDGNAISENEFAEFLLKAAEQLRSTP